MVSALESKTALSLITDDAADTANWMLRRTSGTWESRRLQLLDTGPGVIGYYSEGAAALAVDYYDDARGTAPGSYSAVPVILDRTVNIRRGIAWASEPLATDDNDTASARLVEIFQSEVVRPHRDTVLTNLGRDPQGVGFRRYTSSGACAFCRALADRGAVYRENSAYFAAHSNCRCTAGAVFRGGESGPAASTMQYIASSRVRTAKQRQQIRDWVARYET